MDLFLEAMEERRSQFEELIFLQEPYTGFDNYKKYSKEAVAKHPGFIFADFHLLTYKKYKELTFKYNLSKCKPSKRFRIFSILKLPPECV